MRRTLLGLVIGFTTIFAGFSAQAIEVGDTVPCIDLRQVNLDGTITEECITDREDPSQFLMLEFFQTTCGACKVNFPEVQALAAELAVEETTRIVALDRDEARVHGYIGEHKAALVTPVVLDSQRIASKAFGIRYTPTLFVLDQNNTVIFKFIGVIGDAEKNEIRRLVRSK